MLPSPGILLLVKGDCQNHVWPPEGAHGWGSDLYMLLFFGPGLEAISNGLEQHKGHVGLVQCKRICNPIDQSPALLPPQA